MTEKLPEKFRKILSRRTVGLRKPSIFETRDALLVTDVRGATAEPHGESALRTLEYAHLAILDAQARSRDTIERRRYGGRSRAAIQASAR